MKNSKISSRKAIKEKAIRELEKRYANERDSLTSFIQEFFRSELNKEFMPNWHHTLIEEKLKKVLTGDITRLIITIPPGSGKTELITKCFPVWALGNHPHLWFISTGYSATLTQGFGSEARDYYMSDTFRKIFPRSTPIRKDIKSKGFWQTEYGGKYYATGVGGTITGKRANIFIIDDPIKPDEADKSDTQREAVNTWYDNTVLSRLFNAETSAVIIVAQRTHENDLPGYLLDKMKEEGDQWEHVSIPALAEEDDDNRKAGQSYHRERFSENSLHLIRKSEPQVFSTQYQQQPFSKLTQEFHEEFFKYYTDMPDEYMRTFTVVDPAFSTRKTADQSSIITGGFVKDKLYIFEYTVGRFDGAELLDKIIYHAKKWKPEKVGIESVAAQTLLLQSVRNRAKELGMMLNVVDIKSRENKVERIRNLQAPIRHGKIIWRKDMYDLEQQLLRFPRGKHDDIIDSLTMLYEIHNPGFSSKFKRALLKPTYDKFGRASYQKKWF